MASRKQATAKSAARRPAQPRPRRLPAPPAARGRRATPADRSTGPGLSSATAPAATAELTYSDLITLVELIERASAFSEFRLKCGAIEVEFKRKGAPGMSGMSGVTDAGAPPTASSTAMAGTAPTTATPPATAAAPGSTPRAAAPPATAAAGGAMPIAPVAEGLIAVTAPMIGTLYRAPQPGAAPFIEIGSRVEAGATLCILEVMKLMNTIDAPGAGTVVEIRVADAQPVNTGDVLIVIDPRH
jgi:acetyl-CoA carboxylase biotin carboxyl carrier protein